MSQEFDFTLCIPPNQSTYTVESSTDEYLRQQLKGGYGRYRRDVLDASKIINATWTVGCTLFNYLNAASRVFISEMMPFYLDLIIGDAEMRNVKCWFLPGTFKLSSVNGLVYTVTAQLEIETPDYPVNCDAQFITVVNEFGVNYIYWLNFFNDIINVQFPQDTAALANPLFPNFPGTMFPNIPSFNKP